MTKLIEYLKEEAIRLANIPQRPINPMTYQELTDYETVTICNICGYDFADPESRSDPNYKVRDLCRYTGAYGGTIDCVIWLIKFPYIFQL